jgi:alpha-ketoglutarate-dependent taurine dioxygenase
MNTAAHAVTSCITYDRLTVPALRELLDTHGYAYVRDIPGRFDHAAFLAGIGPLMPQYDGELIWSIKAEERYADLYHSLNTKGLHPHTECYEFTGRPPKYLALWCIVTGEDDGGHTTLADMYRFLDTLTARERERLATIRYEFCSSNGVKDMELGRVAEHPFVEQLEGRPPIVRFSVNNVDPAGDTLLPSVLERAVTYFDEEHVSVGWEPNALLIWDNHRMTHSRTAYTDNRRHLRRVWLDER